MATSRVKSVPAAGNAAGRATRVVVVARLIIGAAVVVGADVVATAGA